MRCARRAVFTRTHNIFAASSNGTGSERAGKGGWLGCGADQLPLEGLQLRERLQVRGRLQVRCVPRSRRSPRPAGCFRENGCFPTARKPPSLLSFARCPSPREGRSRTFFPPPLAPTRLLRMLTLTHWVLHQARRKNEHPRFYDCNDEWIPSPGDCVMPRPPLSAGRRV